jgi:hypothetical protein
MLNQAPPRVPIRSAAPKQWLLLQRLYVPLGRILTRKWDRHSRSQGGTIAR